MSGERGYASVPERITWTTGFRCATDKLVLGALSTFANFETGKGARVRVNKLAARAELPKRTVQRGLHRLEADGWIVAVRRQHKGATAWDIQIDRLATTWVAMKAVGVMSSFPQGDKNLNVTSGAQLNATRGALLDATRGAQDQSFPQGDTFLNVTSGAQDPILNATGGAQLNATGGAQIPSTERSPVQDGSPVRKEPALRAAPQEQSETPPTTNAATHDANGDEANPLVPQQLTFGPQDVRPPPPVRDPNWSRRFADTIRTALQHTAERKKHG
jgi:hypothetical protein